jgi:fermentation-respiration switch protein FrsA (DUF1100 family)
MKYKHARIVALPLLAYLLAALAMTLLQRELLYKPDLTPIQPPRAYQVAAEAITLQGEAGTLAAWYAPAAKNMPMILYFQGNGGNFSGRIHKFQALLKRGFGLLALSYRGFNGSMGNPTEAGLYADARTALHWLKQHHPKTPLLYYGESLGSGVAVQLATEDPPALVVLEAPYTSIADRAQEIYWWLPVHLLLRDKFESLKKISNLHAPLLIIHNDGDNVIPVHHGRTLFAAAKPPKKAYWLKQNGHIDFD